MIHRVPPLLRALAGVVALAAAASLPGQSVFKCTAANGDVTFQDHACAKDLRQSVQVVDTPRAATPATVPFDKLPAAPDASAPAAPPPVAPEPAAEPARAPVTPIWFCTRPDDDTHYVSRTGDPVTHWVPAGFGGITQRHVNKTAKNAPGADAGAPAGADARKPPPPADRTANGLVEIQDDCEPATEQQACSYFEGELDRVEKRLHRAFKDEREQLEPQAAQLRQDMAGC